MMVTRWRSINSAHFRRLERIRISDDAHAIDERKPKRDGATEAVEKWERREDQIVSRRVEHDAKLRDVADQIAVTQRRPLSDRPSCRW